MELVRGVTSFLLLRSRWRDLPQSITVDFLPFDQTSVSPALGIDLQYPHILHYWSTNIFGRLSARLSRGRYSCPCPTSLPEEEACCRGIPLGRWGHISNIDRQEKSPSAVSRQTLIASCKVIGLHFSTSLQLGNNTCLQDVAALGYASCWINRYSQLSKQRFHKIWNVILPPLPIALARETSAQPWRCPHPCFPRQMQVMNASESPFPSSLHLPGDIQTRYCLKRVDWNH